ncbi:MAG: PAS domain S-box protein [Deltaproteobacteria bacterium]|nr:PAS domain S-box protein [Deltaproteobacteria bacterium]
MTHKILIIEDNPVEMQLACKMFEKIKEYEIFQAKDAFFARECLKMHKIEIVLCDIGLPGESGLDLTKFIIGAYENIIVIILSASDDLHTSEKAIENGAFSYLVKPVKSSQLRISIANALKIREYQKLIRDQQTSLEEKIKYLELTKSELEKSEEEFRSIFENIQEGFYRSSLDGKIIMANPVALKIMGYTSFEEVKGFETTDFYKHPEDRDKLLEKIDKYGAVLAYEVEIVRKDGDTATILVSSHKRKDHSGKVLGLEGTIVDITDRKLLEAELAQAQKLESIGQLAAGIAHEINTPIQYIGDNLNFVKDAFEDLNELVKNFTGFLETAKKERPDKLLIEDMESNLEDADFEFLAQEVPVAILQSLEGVEHVRKIVKSMKEFAHPGGGEKVMVDIHKAIENTVTVAKNEWKYVADLILDFDDSLPMVSCNPGEINQVLLNMIINASHAIADVLDDRPEGKGKIIIGTKNKKNKIEISIRDTGAGIRKEARNKIFDPFFTTKKVGKGTGQGLAISYSIIVDKHKGKIFFHTEPGKGTIFTIILPKKN